MREDVTFRPYLEADQQACLDLFDGNCPEYFSPNEREDYLNFLDGCPSDYELCVALGKVVGAFGVCEADAKSRSLNWILLDPNSQGRGVGSQIMARVSTIVRTSGANALHIAASHKSAAFFEKFGAIRTTVTNHGWGPDMHRVDMVLQYEVWQIPPAGSP